MTPLALGKTALISSYLFLCIACGGSTKVSDKDDFFIPATKGTVTDNAFDPERLLQVSIQLPEADFDILKEEGRTLDQALSECPSQDFEYSDFVAKVNIDGQTLENVAIRKKGYLGSLSRFRPSLKLNFDTHEEGRTFKTLKRMTLNNNRQDPSFVRQCLAYDLFSKAGIIAPRCNLAQVYVNGNDLGVYSHIESIKKPFLERTFKDKSGNLYEAQVADLGTHLKDKFELKTNKTLNDRSDLAAFSSVLDEGDDTFLDELKKYIDLDEFITYWAIESMIGHWDSATGNSNNFYMYHNPADGLFHFIPWGTDAAFTGENIFKPNSGPLYQNLSLASRLYAIEESRDLYHSELLDLLSRYWVEADLIASIDKISNLTQAQTGASNHLKEFIKGNSENSSQHTTLTTAINNQAADQIKYLLKDEVLDCTTPVTKMALTASFSSGSSADFGTFQFTDRDGAAHIANINYATVGPKGVDSLVYLHNTSTLPSTHNLTAVGVTLLPSTISLDKVYSLQIMLEDPQYTPGKYALHGISNNVMLFEVLSKEGDAGHPVLDTIAVGHSGTITLENTGDGSATSKIKGSINATMTIVPEVD